MIDLKHPQAIISASLEEAEFIAKLFPFLSPCSPNYNIPFFSIKNVTSQEEFSSIKSLSQPYIVISNVLFEEKVTLDMLKSLSLSFAQYYMRSRKKTVSVPEHKELLPFLVEFIYDMQSEDEESEIIELFDTVGTRQFPQKFVSLTMNRPVFPFIAAVVTFLTKLQNPTTLFYKKASERLLRKFNQNNKQASETYSMLYSYNLSEPENVLLFIKYHSDLFQV